ncbi:putative F420-dependent oxidoreductase [Herbihabitans rhizosphaerae]|uniref:Putative F420-dependent oxidoreductase n=1 Tax=Herbihabitans rhizosphaerae TaxID=1872711 RepID=A0A4V2EUI6_9PSEU|nr:TIGR03619 family F420-dependent LLM class oxidoreductase [Herbihabitans rhizosphaerae]RZS44703.1 putative F420-dependent oxidoreductase [Herbihabitans rhizosphaerae]
MEPHRLAVLAAEAERLGYRGAWLPDHLLPPGRYGQDRYGGVYEPLVSLSYLAAHTSTIRLGTSVLVLPMRNPFVVAKQAATLDRISGERLTLGVGIGWDRTEFAAVGADFHTRGARTDEAIRLLRHLFHGEGPFHGEFYGYDDGVFEPRPRRHLPIMVGGTSDAALRRAARLADEWQAVGLEPREFAERLARLRESSDRDVRATARIAWHGGRAEFQRAVDQAHGFADAGAAALAVWFTPAEGFEERMAEFAAQFG